MQPIEYILIHHPHQDKARRWIIHPNTSFRTSPLTLFAINIWLLALLFLKRLRMVFFFFFWILIRFYILHIYETRRNMCVKNLHVLTIFWARLSLGRAHWPHTSPFPTLHIICRTFQSDQSYHLCYILKSDTIQTITLHKIIAILATEIWMFWYRKWIVELPWPHVFPIA